MPSRIPSGQFLRSLQTVRFATQTAAKPASTEQANPLVKQEPKLTTLPNGIVVASVENYSPISRVSVSFKAGSRYENANNLGITHSLRNYAGISTQNATVFGITRNIQQIGGSLTASATREHMSYNVECIRDNLDAALNFLLQVTTKQVFKPWEVKDFSPRLKLDLAALKSQPQVVVLEQLHKAAYRAGLGNSLYTPTFMLGEHEPEMLQHFVKQHFTTNRAAVVGVGVCHDALVKYAESLPIDSGVGPSVEPTKYGGGEIRVDTGDNLAFVAVATEGASLKTMKEALALAVLQNVLGSAPRIKWSDGLPASTLAQIASKATDKPFAISALNINYSDSGLFGFYTVAHHNDVGKVLKSVFGHYSSLTKTGVKDEDVQRAKHQLKATISMAQETDSQLADELAVQSLVSGQLVSLADLVKAVDSLTANDVTAVAKKVINGKPSMAAVGNLSNTPYLDQLI